jgi:hypothetical protein
VAGSSPMLVDVVIAAMARLPSPRGAEPQLWLRLELEIWHYAKTRLRDGEKLPKRRSIETNLQSPDPLSLFGDRSCHPRPKVVTAQKASDFRRHLLRVNVDWGISKPILSNSRAPQMWRNGRPFRATTWHRSGFASSGRGEFGPMSKYCR